MTDLTRRGVLRAGTAGVAALAVPSGQAFAQATQPKRGGTVVVATDAAPPSLDGQITSAQEARNINLHMYETLYARDENASPVPDLAQGVQIAKDGLTYTFTLRPGVRFHNGKTMGSGDVVASLERYRKVGASPALLGAVDRIEASGPLEVTIRLKRGQSSFIDSISSPRAPIAIYPAEEAVKPLKDFHYIGTGPFKFVEYAPDSHVTLDRFDGYTANPNYNKRDGFAGHKQVYVDRGIWRFMPESGARLAALQTGEATIVETVNGSQAKQLAGKPQYKVLKVLPFLLQVFKFNHAVAPCGDVNFRRAVTACLNMEETMAIAYPDINELDGSWVFPNSPYHTKAGLTSTTRTIRQRPRRCWRNRATRARSSPSSSITPAVIPMRRPTSPSSLRRSACRSIFGWPTGRPYRRSGWGRRAGISGRTASASSHTRVRPRVMGVWVNGLSQQKDDPQIDKLFAEFEAEMDKAKQKDIFAQFQSHMWEDAVALQLGDFGLFQVINTKLQNFAPYRIPRLWGDWLAS